MSLPSRATTRKDQLLKEVEALIRLYDVTELHRLREKLAPKWWESGLRILMFVSGLGFIVTVYKLIPSSNWLLFGFVFFWFFLFVVTTLGVIEYLILKMRALTRFCEYQARVLAQLAQVIDKKKSLDVPTEAEQETECG